MLDGRRTVRDVVHRSGRTVLEVCHALKDLVERGAIEIVAPVAEVPSGRPATPHAVAPVNPYGPGVDHEAPATRRPLGKPIEVVTGPIAPLPEVPEPHLGVVVDTFDRPQEAAEETEARVEPLVRAEDPGEADEAPDDGASTDGEGDGARDRRALLRLFSGLRDT